MKIFNMSSELRVVCGVCYVNSTGERARAYIVAEEKRAREPAVVPRCVYCGVCVRPPTRRVKPKCCRRLNFD
ncbi:ORF136 [Lymantria xylina nucleopolyhedrovirus]|uniref:ORF136 n=1 Tax=Lymantria xylina multiple nucleopolyhedrovirus TaxID=2847840 RepID=D4N2H3_9ABAC|nr:ORF136 [Lymantria xylina nucleopolyhedrovirus]ADD73845.1 ORF136 [Lymantria xylina nucleopolyhedrovirus]